MRKPVGRSWTLAAGLLLLLALVWGARQVFRDGPATGRDALPGRPSAPGARAEDGLPALSGLPSRAPEVGAATDALARRFLRIVVRDEEEKPVAGARLWMARRPVGETDAEGVARVDVSEPYPYVVVVARGYVTSVEEVAHAGESHLVRLRRGAVVEGEVRDARTGEPLPGTFVRTGEREHAEGADEFPWFQEAVTDDAGRFRLDSLGTSDGKLWAERRGYSRATTPIDVDDEGHAVPDRVVLDLEPAGSLRVAVRRSDGAPASRAVLVLCPEGLEPYAPGAFVDPWYAGHGWPEAPYLLARADEEGRAHVFGLPFGTRFELAVLDEAEADVLVPRSVLATPEAPEVALDVRLRATATLRIRCRELDPADVEQVSVEVDGASSRDREDCDPAAGTVTVTRIVPGRRTVTVTAVDRIAVAFTEDFGEGRTVERTIAFERGEALSGVVVDSRGDGVPHARLTVEPLDSAQTRRHGWCDEHGVFRIGGLRPDVCKLRVEPPGHGSDRTPFVVEGIGIPATGLRLVLRKKPEVVARLRVPHGSAAPASVGLYRWVGGSPSVWDRPPEDGLLRWVLDEPDARIGLHATGYALWEKDVRVPPGDVLDLGEILLDPGVDLAGDVLDPDGRPLAGAEVEMDHVHGPETKSGPDGRFLLPHVPRAFVWLTVTREGFLPADVPVDAQDPPEAFRVILRRGGLLRVVVVTAAGGAGLGYTVAADAVQEGVPEPNYERETTDAEGRFAVRLSPGPYRVRVFRGDDSEEALAAADATLVEGTESTLEIRLP